MKLRIVLACILLVPALRLEGQSLDVYGGFSGITMPGCVSTGYFQQMLVSNQWAFVDSLCHPFPYIGIDLMGYAQYQSPDNSTSPSSTGYSVILAKYGSGGAGAIAAWASHIFALARHYYWTSIGVYSDAVSVEGYHSTNQVPKFVFVAPEKDAIYHPNYCGSYSYPVKDIFASINYSVFTTIGYHATFLDVEDPIVADCVHYEFFNSGGIVSTLSGAGVTLSGDPWTVAIVSGDMDSTWAFRCDGSGQQCPHMGMMAAVTNPVGICTSVSGFTCSTQGQGGTGTQTWMKAAWIAYLQGKYGSGAGGVTAVNAAWSTGGFYTCWGPSTWGTGTCIADEDGRHTWFGGPTADAYLLAGVNANLKADLDHMLYQVAYDYVHTLVSGANAYDSGHHLKAVGDFFGTGRQGISTLLRTQVLDGFKDGGIDFLIGMYQGYFNNHAQLQLMYQETGLPVVLWYGSDTATCDTPEKSFAGYCPSPGTDGYTDYATQGPASLGTSRAAHYATDVATFQAVTATYGGHTDRFIDGFEVWGQSDNNPPTLPGWGFLTTLQDNPLDGVCNATGSHTDAVGQSCGGEPYAMGDFLDGAGAANAAFQSSLYTALGGGGGGGNGGMQRNGKASGARVR